MEYVKIVKLKVVDSSQHLEYNTNVNDNHSHKKEIIYNK